jgi:ParB family chromosome partitioning protein
MDALPAQVQEVDLHRLELRFAATRLLAPQAIAQLAASIERSGQLVPCYAVTVGDRLVLVDGYRRVQALRRLGRDTAGVEAWTCDLAQALLQVLARLHQRPFLAIEEALLVRELVHSQGLSEREVARRCGRDGSWVSRRLQLVCGLPDTLLTAVVQGELSPWAAIRVLAPLARANTADAEQLLAALAKTPLSTRELRCWFDHYQRTPPAGRAAMVAAPRLFLTTLTAQADERAAAQLRAGPEDPAASEARQLLALGRRLGSRLPTLRPFPPDLQPLFTRLQQTLSTLLEELSHHDPASAPRGRANPPGPGPEPARHQPRAAAVA